MSTQAQEQLQHLMRGVVDVVVEKEFLQRLKGSRPLVVKAGFDPTRPDLHLGHSVLLQKMKQFQSFGHQVVFVVGDFTARIGDPSGRSATRPVLDDDEIQQGAKSYADQAFKILDRDLTRIVYNNDWLGSMQFADVIRLAGRYTLARMMERDDFKKRWAAHKSISLHELLYPLAQAYDSVVLECDVELGGTDQLFNLMVGREIMKEYGLRPQLVMTTPILEGINAQWVDGSIVGEKMSKSLDNYVALDEDPKEQFGKLMSISDPLMWRYAELLSEQPWSNWQELQKACEQGDRNPRDVKATLAEEIVRRYHGQNKASQAAEDWFRQFSAKENPVDLPEKRVPADENQELWIPKALALAGLVSSSSEGRRRVQQGGVEIDGQRVTDLKATLKRGKRYVVRAGKRAWAVICVE